MFVPYIIFLKNKIAVMHRVKGKAKPSICSLDPTSPYPFRDAGITVMLFPTLVLLSFPLVVVSFCQKTNISMSTFLIPIPVTYPPPFSTLLVGYL